MLRAPRMSPQLLNRATSRKQLLKKLSEEGAEIHPAAAAGLIGVGLLGASAIAAPIRMGYSKAGINYANKPDAKRDSIHKLYKEHPYLTSFGGDVAQGVTGLSRLVTSVPERAAGVMAYERAKKNRKADGVANFAIKHPHITGVGSYILPGMAAARYTAGEAVAEKAMKNKGFIYNHPQAAASLIGAIPGLGGVYGHAAGRIA